MPREYRTSLPYNSSNAPPVKSVSQVRQGAPESDYPQQQKKDRRKLKHVHPNLTIQRQTKKKDRRKPKHFFFCPPRTSPHLFPSNATKASIGALRCGPYSLPRVHEKAKSLHVLLLAYMYVYASHTRGRWGQGGRSCSCWSFPTSPPTAAVSLYSPASRLLQYTSSTSTLRPSDKQKGTTVLHHSPAGRMP